MPENVYILAGARTPFAVWARGRRGDGRRGGTLAKFGPFDLGAAALKEALVRAGLSPEGVDRVVFANTYHDSPHSCYGARYVGLRAGVPVQVPCLTVAMACGGGLNSIIEAAQDVRTGETSVVAAGGTDNVSLLGKDMFLPSFYDLAVGKQIGETVEPLARKRGITRGDMDKWALRSHRRARAAQAGGRLGAEIVAVGGVREDDAVLPEAREGRIGRARSAFGKGGEVTSGNTHSITDGASALIIAGERSIPTGAEPLGRVASCAYVGMAPDQMGAASVPAIQEVLKRAGWRLAEVDLFEINETFAAQLLIDIGDLGIDPERVNVNGGSIAIGHPFAGTGGRLVLGLLQELCRRKLKRGVAAICVGAGQGVAVAVERG